MVAEELYRRVKDKKVYDVLLEAHYDLSMQKPSAAAVHARSNVINALSLHIQMRREGIMPKDQTFKEFKASDPKHFKNTMQTLVTAMHKFKARV